MKRGYDDTIHQYNLIYEWKIKKITPLINSNKTKELRSSKFSSVNDINDEWCLIFIFNNEESSCYKDWISLFIHHNLSDHENVDADYELYIIQNDGCKQVIKNSKGYWTKDTNTYGTYKFYNKEQLLNEKDTILSDDVLTIGIKLTVYNNIEIPCSPKKKTENRIKSRFSDLFETREGSDCVIYVQDQPIKAHKTILLTSSPVLRQMLCGNYVEKEKNEVHIPDIRPKVFEKFLEYCYTDEVTGLHEVDEELLEAADKYGVDSLTEICAKSLAKELDVDNAVRRLVLADNHCIEKLKECILDFIINRAAEIMESSDFQLLREEKPRLSSMLFKRLIEINQENTPKIINYS